MAKPVLIDTDMGVDDALAVSLALNCDALDVVGLASVGGNVDCDQATQNIGRLLAAIEPAAMPPIGVGHDQNDADLVNATHVFGWDGFGEIDITPPSKLDTVGAIELYGDLLERHAGELIIVAIGPLTNLAAVHAHDPNLLEKANRLIVMGGAVWCKGNVTPHAEFNFYRDPVAADRVLKLNVPTTLVPLDVTRQVALDESHTAHLAASGTRAGELLSNMLEFQMRAGDGGQTGRVHVHDALAVGALLWPELFMQTTLWVDVKTDDGERGRCVPGVGGGDAHRVSVLMSLKAVDFLENLLETLCRERFVV
jgi:inosine-uridine nucleoside N-ribohydrolase